METTNTPQPPHPHPWWVSWHAAGAFEYNGPWWISGHSVTFDPDDISKGVSLGQPMFCAAVMAPDSDTAEEIILAAHDERPQLMEWRFVDARPDDWNPFTERFPRAEWMVWP